VSIIRDEKRVRVLDACRWLEDMLYLHRSESRGPVMGVKFLKMNHFLAVKRYLGRQLEASTQQ
jgi:hypothetical protein